MSRCDTRQQDYLAPQREAIAWATLEPPDVSGGGGARRQHFLLRALESHFDVRVLVADATTELRPTAVQRASARLRPRSAAPPCRGTAFSERVRATCSQDGIDTLVVAHLETAAALGNLLSDKQFRIVLDLHNVYSAYYRERGEVRAGRSWEFLERKACSAATALSVLSKEDGRIVGAHNRQVTVVPNAVSLDEWRLSSTGRPHGLAYFGSWNHTPNQTGLTWFLREVWPLVQAFEPGGELHLYGPGRPDTHDAKNVHVHGRVEDLNGSLQAHLGIVVPIIKGVGTRVKFIEAIATGRPVVSTSLGAQGYDMPDGTFLRADTAQDFAAGCIRALQGDQELSVMAGHGRAFVADNFTWEGVGTTLARVVGAVVRS